MVCSFCATLCNHILCIVRPHYTIYYFLYRAMLHTVIMLLQSAKISAVHSIDGSTLTRIEVTYGTTATTGNKKYQLLHHEAGQYALVCIPSINSWQWHPFTISSSPHQVSAFTFHIKSVTGGTANSWSKRDAKLTPGAQIRYVILLKMCRV
jgi:predicted ferric reductase